MNSNNKRSITEQTMIENKKAQVAALKLQCLIEKKGSPGFWFDVDAVKGLIAKESGK